MAFPQTPLQVRVDLNLGGNWVDVTSDALTRDPITISRGRADEASRVDASTCKLTLKNPTGKYSARNPTGPYYGLLGRNTPLRVGVGVPPAGAGTPGQTGTSIVAPSVNAEAAGGLFCVWAASPVGNFTGPGGFTMGTELDGNVSTWIYGSKVVSAGPTGTSTATFSTAATAAAAMSVWVPGASSWTRVASLGTGGLEPLLSPTVVAGQYLLALYGWSSDPTNAMQDVPAEDGTATSQWMLIADTGPSTGPRIKAFIRRVTVAGTLSVVFRSGLYTSPDAFGALYTITGATDYYPRFVGEVSEWPPRWDLSGKDVTVAVQASGILRRLGHGASPLRSALLREITAGVSASDVMAYWPLEDPAGSTLFASGLSGGPPMRFLGFAGATPALAADDTFVCSDALPTFTDAGAVGSVPAYTATNAFSVGALMSFPTLGMTDGTTLLTVTTTGSVATWVVKYYSGGSGGFRIQTYDSAGALITDETASTWTVPPPGARFFLYLSAAPSGADIARTLMYIPIVAGSDFPSAQQWATTITGRTAGRVTKVSVGTAVDLTGAPTIGHVVVARAATTLFTGAIFSSLVAWNGEQAQARFFRVCREQSVPYYLPWQFYLASRGLASQAMGYQRPKAFLDLLAELEEVDGAVVHEPRGFVGLGYRAGASKYNQAAALTLSYSAGQVAEPFEPADDDQGLVNDVTVTRPDGSSARATLDVGALSTQAPPAGVGRYDTVVEVNVHNDTDLPDQAAWRVHRYTWDEARYPSVSIDLAHDPGLIPAVAALDIGDRVTVTGLPAWLPPNGADLIAEGFTEVLGHPNDWDVTINASPAGPYLTGVYDDTSNPGARYSSDGSTLAAGATSGATSLSVATPSGPLWGTPDGAFDIVVAGERMTVTAVTGAASPQTFTVTRSVNNVVKAQAAGATVALYRPAYYSL